MRRATALALILLAAPTAAAVLAAPGPTRASDGGPWQATPTATPGLSPCQPTYDKVAAPRQVRLGEEVAITLTAKAACPVPAVHMVLVLEDSAYIEPVDQPRVKDAATHLVTSLELDAHPEDRVGVVSFARLARTECLLTNDASAAQACIQRLQFSGTAAVDAGLREGLRVLMQGRPTGGADPWILEDMILFATCLGEADCRTLQQTAAVVKGQGVLLITVCVAQDCRVDCLRSAATSVRYYYDLDTVRALWQGFATITQPTAAAKRLTITDRLPAQMELVAGSARPMPSHGDPATGLTWVASYVPVGGITITFRVRPLAAGAWPTNAEATGELEDFAGAIRQFTFPVPTVTVLDQAPSPTPTEAPPTPTMPPTATATPAATVGPPTWRAYLPLLARSARLWSGERLEQVASVRHEQSGWSLALSGDLAWLRLSTGGEVFYLPSMQRSVAEPRYTYYAVSTVDVRDPGHPVELADMAVDWEPHQVVARDSLAYFAALGDGLKVLDGRDPAHPAVVATVAARRCAVTAGLYGNHLYLLDAWVDGHCPMEADPDVPDQLRLFDITDPVNPREVASMPLAVSWGAQVLATPVPTVQP